MSASQRLWPRVVETMMIVVMMSRAGGDEMNRSRAEYERALARRRRGYVEWIHQTFGRLESQMELRDGRRWALNHSRLVLGRERTEANQYFETFGPVPHDADIYFIHLLKTFLDFRESSRLSEAAKRHIIEYLVCWPDTPPSSEAHWPPRHTENHDLRHLTIRPATASKSTWTA